MSGLISDTQTDEIGVSEWNFDTLKDESSLWRSVTKDSKNRVYFQNC